MHATPIATHVAGWVLAVLCAAAGIWEIRRGPVYGESRQGPWMFAFTFLAGAAVVLTLARDLHGARVISAAIGTPLVLAAALALPGALRRRKVRRAVAAGPRLSREGR